jgi:hypothetical protein
VAWEEDGWRYSSAELSTLPGGGIGISLFEGRVENEINDEKYCRKASPSCNDFVTWRIGEKSSVSDIIFCHAVHPKNSARENEEALRTLP